MDHDVLLDHCTIAMVSFVLFCAVIMLCLIIIIV